jgi:hypothetical protein
LNAKRKNEEKGMASNLCLKENLRKRFVRWGYSTCFRPNLTDLYGKNLEATPQNGGFLGREGSKEFEA